MTLATKARTTADWIKRFMKSPRVRSAIRRSSPLSRIGCWHPVAYRYRPTWSGRARSERCFRLVCLAVRHRLVRLENDVEHVPCVYGRQHGRFLTRQAPDDVADALLDDADLARGRWWMQVVRP